MAKRFADTNLSNEAWYRRLSPTFKAAWRFLTDACDVAGCWSIDQDSMNFHVNDRVEIEDFVRAVNADKSDRLVIFDEGRKLLVTGFIQFQYVELKTECKPHKPIIKRCRELQQLKGYPKGFDTLQEKEKEKDQDKEKETEKGGEISDEATPTMKPAAKAFVQIWNDVAGVKLPRVVGVNKSRSRRIAERLREEPDLGVWTAVFGRIRDSSFCSGGNDQGWRADFDWVLQPDVRLKVLEGRYDNRAGPPGAKTNVDPMAALRAKRGGA